MTTSTSAKIRVGVIGAGNWANHAHFPVLALLPEFELSVVQGRRREAAESASSLSARPGHELVTLLPVFSGNSIKTISTVPEGDSSTAARHRAGTLWSSANERSNVFPNVANIGFSPRERDCRQDDRQRAKGRQPRDSSPTGLRHPAHQARPNLRLPTPPSEQTSPAHARAL
jgi:hypothetical protein